MDQISPLESENQNPLRNHIFSAYLKFSLKNTGSYTKNIVGLKGNRVYLNTKKNTCFKQCVENKKLVFEQSVVYSRTTCI